MLPQQRHQRSIRLALVAPAEQQHEGPRECGNRNGGGGQVGGLGIVDPEHALHFADRLHAVGQRHEAPQSQSEVGRLDAGRLHRKRGGERVGDVVIAEQREFSAREQSLRPQHQPRGAPVVPAIGPALHRKAELPPSPRHSRHHRL